MKATGNRASITSRRYQSFSWSISLKASEHFIVNQNESITLLDSFLKNITTL